MKNLVAKNKCDLVILSGDKYDLRILQSNWLKAFPAITQDQEFPQIWDLYSKTDNNIKFYLSTFPDKFFLISGSFLTLFCCFFPNRILPKIQSRLATKPKIISPL